MEIQIIRCLQDNYSYLIIDKAKNIACVIDPSEAKPVIKYLEDKNIHLKYILNTHHHYDHVGGNKELKEKYGASVIGYKGDKDRIPEIDILVGDQDIWHKKISRLKYFIYLVIPLAIYVFIFIMKSLFLLETPSFHLVVVKFLKEHTHRCIIH